MEQEGASKKRRPDPAPWNSKRSTDSNQQVGPTDSDQRQQEDHDGEGEEE